MPRYWTCNNVDCEEFDGQTFTSDHDETPCPRCGRPLTELGAGSVSDDEAAMVARWADGTLARAWVANELAGEDNTACEAEIRRRAGAVKPMEWAEETIHTKPSGMGFERGLYD